MQKAKRKAREIRWDVDGSNQFLCFAQDRERNVTMLIYQRSYPSASSPGLTFTGKAAIEWTPQDGRNFDGRGGRATGGRFEFEGEPVP